MPEKHTILGGKVHVYRMTRPADAPPLGIIRSLAYFLPVIEEVLQLQVGPEYFRHLRSRIARITPAQ